MISPIVIDNYIQGWTGGLGRHVVDLIDKGLIAAGVSPAKHPPEATPADLPLIKAFAARFPTAGANSIQDFYNLSDERIKSKATIDMLRKSGRTDEANIKAKTEAVANPTGIRTALGQMFGAASGVYNNPDMPANDKRKLLDIMYFQMIAMAKSGLKELDRTRIQPRPVLRLPVLPQPRQLVQ